VVFAADVAVARFFVVDLPAGRLAVALLPAALLATPVPDRRAVDDARLAAVDLPAVFLVAVAVPLRAAEPDVAFFPVAALRAVVVFFVAALAVADPVAPLAVALPPTVFLAAAFFADFFATFLLVDFRGLVVAMRVSLRINAELRRSPSFDSTTAMHAK